MTCPTGGARAMQERVSSSASSGSERPAVLMLTSCFPPVLDSGTRRPARFAMSAADNGYRVVVATARQPTLPSDAALLDEVPDSVRVERAAVHSLVGLRRGLPQWLPAAPQRAVSTGIGRLARCSIPGSWRVAWAPLSRISRDSAQSERIDLVWATGPHFGILEVGARIARRLRVPFVADYRDPWTYGLLSRAIGPLSARIERWKEANVLRAADKVVFASPLTKRRYSVLYPDDRRRFVCIPNGFDDVDLVEPDATSVARAEKLTLTYLGRTGSYRRRDVFLAGLRLLVERHPEIAASYSVRFVGSCDDVATELDHPKIASIVQGEGVVPYAQSKQLMRTSDALLLLQTIEGPGSDVISGKLVEYLAARRPRLGVVAPEGGDAWLLQRAGTGIVAGLTPEGICRGLITLWQGWRDGAPMPSPDRRWLDEFEWKHLGRRLVDIFEEVRRVPSRAK